MKRTRMFAICQSQGPVIFCCYQGFWAPGKSWYVWISTLSVGVVLLFGLFLIRRVPHLCSRRSQLHQVPPLPPFPGETLWWGWGEWKEPRVPAPSPPSPFLRVICALTWDLEFPILAFQFFHVLFSGILDCLQNTTARCPSLRAEAFQPAQLVCFCCVEYLCCAKHFIYVSYLYIKYIYIYTYIFSFNPQNSSPRVIVLFPYYRRQN